MRRPLRKTPRSLIQRRRSQTETVGAQRVALGEGRARAAQDAAEAEPGAQLVEGVVEAAVAVGAAGVVGAGRWAERGLVGAREELALPAGRGCEAVEADADALQERALPRQRAVERARGLPQLVGRVARRGERAAAVRRESLLRPRTRARIRVDPAHAYLERARLDAERAQAVRAALDQ